MGRSDPPNGDEVPATDVGESSTAEPTSVRRHDVLCELAAASDAERGATTTVAAVARACEADETAVRACLEGLADCDLARVSPDGRTRVTTTGEELLALEAAGPVIVDTGGGGFTGDRPQSADDMEADRR